MRINIVESMNYSSAHLFSNKNEKKSVYFCGMAAADPLDEWIHLGGDRYLNSYNGLIYKPKNEILFQIKIAENAFFNWLEACSKKALRLLRR